MTTYNDLNKKFEAKLKQKNWQLDNAAGWERLEKEVLIGDEAKKNSCLGAVVSVLAIGAAVLAVFGSGNVKLRREPLCCCLEYVGDNPPCPVHGDPFGEKEGKS